MKGAIRLIVYTLVITVTTAMVMQSRAEAMLVPANLTQMTPVADKSSDAETIEKTLESKELRGKLHALGLSDAEIQTRLSRLSDAQRHQLASQIRAVHPAGDGGGFVIGILVVVVLVLLIIYLVKRV